MTMVAVGAAVACSDDGGDGNQPGGGSAGMGGTAGSGGGAGLGGGGASSGGTSGSTAVPPPPPTPALPANAATVACGMTINGSLDATDPSQTGRHSRIPPVSACGVAKAYPGNGADATGPHLFDVYRFSNPGAAAVCFNFTLSYGGAGVVEVSDAGSDAAVVSDAGSENPVDAAVTDAGGDAAPPVAPPAMPQKYLAAYGTFYPTDLAREFLGDVGDTLNPPQSMGITVPAGDTIDVVVYGIDQAPGSAGAYTLSCATQ
jgi:hypothetical protein